MFQEDALEFGIDWTGPSVLENEDDNVINIPKVNCPLDNQELLVLESYFNPLNCDTDDLGASLYVTIRNFVQFCVQDRN